MKKKELISRGVSYLSDVELETIIGKQYLDAAVEYARRKAIREQDWNKIKGSQDAYFIFKPYYTGAETEMFTVMYLKANNTVIGIREISRGGLTGCIADPRVIFRYALELKATAMVLCHNHPSGELRSSAADDELTKKIVNAGKFMDIKVLDHIIIGKDAYLSYADEGRIS